MHSPPPRLPTPQKLDPYMSFESAVDVWARTFAALGIRYRDGAARVTRQRWGVDGFVASPARAGLSPERMVVTHAAPPPPTLRSHDGA